MVLHHLIAVAYDPIDGSWYPVAGVTNDKPFLAGGMLAFQREVYPLHQWQCCTLVARSESASGRHFVQRLSGIGYVADRTHDLMNYIENLCREYLDSLPTPTHL